MIAIHLPQSCGCENEIDPRSGVIHCRFKCLAHQMESTTGNEGEAYYSSLNVMSEADADNHVREFRECFGELVPVYKGKLLEVGPGVSPYVAMVRAAGYRYDSVEPSRWACLKMHALHGTIPQNDRWETVCDAYHGYDAVLCVHALEHMTDAVESLQKMAQALRRGGMLYVIVPDDQDQTNPDHWWFFTQETLAATMRLAGLDVVTSEVRRRIEREQFIYMRGVKP